MSFENSNYEIKELHRQRPTLDVCSAHIFYDMIYNICHAHDTQFVVDCNCKVMILLKE